MGVVNVTPDSFSDGGNYLEADAAIAHGRRLAAEGAHIVDVGGESTRPGAQPTEAGEELRRVVPVVRALAAAGIAVSIDTSKAEVARQSLAAGAFMVNDVTALRGDPQMADVVARAGAALCLMHMQGEPATMQQEPRYDDVVREVRAFLAERLARATGAGVAPAAIALDPGIGFGKTLEHNLLLLRGLADLVSLGQPVLVGASRKRFLRAITGRSAPADLALPSAIAATAALRAGAWGVRVHDVAGTVDALAVEQALAG